jgi:hypothetical protein
VLCFWVGDVYFGIDKVFEMITKNILNTYLPHNIKMIVDMGKLNPKNEGKTKIVELTANNLEIALVYQPRLILKRCDNPTIKSASERQDCFGLIDAGLAVDCEAVKKLIDNY